MKIIILVFIAFFTFSLSGCIKENNLDWLEEKTGTIYKCLYQEEIVYYIQAPCCDQFNDLYDQKGNKICSPSGGFTGSGDGQCPDFKIDDSNCQLIE